MGQETVGKKEREKIKAKNKREKADKKEHRKANNQKGKSLDDMMAYLDENGNITDTPPDPGKVRKVINAEDIQIGPAKKDPNAVVDVIRRGVVTFFNEGKGYGFINDLQSQESVFVHINNVAELIKEKDKVTFEVEAGPRGLSAIRVKKEVK